MVQRYTLDTLDLQGIEYVEDAYVELDYKGAPTIYELEKEIQSGVHTNVDGEVGCPMCGCVDMFYREFNTKGRRYRCNSCFYNSEAQFESVKSQKDITLSSFGLVYVCDICGEEMDSYNKATVLRHLKKHEDANKSFEAESFYVNEKCDDCGISFGNPARWPMVWMITVGDGTKNGKKVLLFCNECHGEQYDESDWDNIIEFEAPELFRADGYGLWTDAQLDAPDAPWTPEVISPIYPLKGYEKPVEEVRAQLKRSLVGQEIRMFGPQNEAEAARMSQSLDWWKTVGFSEPQPVGTFGKVTGVSEVNPNRPWVIGVWVTITQGGSKKHPIGSRVWFHVKDANFPNSLRKGWEKGDYMAEGGQPTQNHIVQKSCLCCGEYPCLQPQGFSNDFIYRPEHEAFFEELKQDYDYSYNPNSGPCGEGSHYFHSKDGVKAMFFQMEEADIMPEIMMMRPQDTFMVLEWLESENAGEGNAGKMLSKITQAADKTGTTLYLDCGYHDFAETPNDIPSDEICGWYETYGFVRAAGDYPRDMIRLPHDTLWLKEQESAFGQTRWAEGEEALYWAARTNMRHAEDYEILRWIKVLRDEDPEGWDDIDWEDDTAPSPYDDDWHDDIDWEAEGSKRTPFDKDPRWLDHYYQQHKRQNEWNPKRNYLDDYYGPSATAKTVPSPNSRRMRKGGLFLNWLNTFGPTVEGMRRLFKFFGIPTPPPPKKQQGSPYQPSTKNPWPWGSPESNPWKKPDDYYPYSNPDRRGEYEK